MYMSEVILISPIDQETFCENLYNCSSTELESSITSSYSLGDKNKHHKIKGKGENMLSIFIGLFIFVVFK